MKNLCEILKMYMLFCLVGPTSMPAAPPPHYHPTPHPDSGWYNQGKNQEV